MKFLPLKSRLEALKNADALRERLTLESAQGESVRLAKSDACKNDSALFNFASNDYLGLANSDQSIKALQNSAEKFGFGSGASHLVVGHQTPHQLFEKEIASFLKRDAALCFSSGYMANLGVIQALTQKGDLIVSDKLNHASLIDGVKLSEADSRRYIHCDTDALEKRLSRSSQNTFVITDSVFSMDGDIAPLDKIAGLCQKYNAILIVDDAHGFGVLGNNGQGAAEYFKLAQNNLPVLISTLGKALGGYGAVVSGEKALVEYLKQTARSYIYTTAMPATIAAANLANLKVIESTSALLTRLKDNILLFKRLCKEQGITLQNSQTPIQPIIIGSNEKLVSVKNELFDKNILVGAIRPPTVPKDSARLRVTITASHQKEQIEYLVNTLKCVLP